MKTVFLIILTSLLTLISCKKDRETNFGLYHAWKAQNFMSVESVTYPKVEGNKILLIFDQSGSYSLNLDINNCNGSFMSGENNQLQILSSGCSKACCDSPFSEKLASMLPKVTSYSIEGTTLKLNVPQWGYIEFEWNGLPEINPNP